MAQQTFTGRKRVRKFFGHIKEVAEMPNLIEVQKASYDRIRARSWCLSQLLPRPSLPKVVPRMLRREA